MANKNVKLTVNKTEYQQSREFSTIEGHTYHVKYEIDGKEIRRISGGLSDLTQFHALDEALKTVLYNASNQYYTVDVTIEGATLPASLQTFLKDKYEVETQINSVTFE